MGRDKPKDAYDVVWLIVGLGPAVSAERVRVSPLLQGSMAGEVFAQLARLAEQFADVDAVGARSYADFLGDENAHVERRFAVEAVAQFWRLLNDPTT